MLFKTTFISELLISDQNKKFVQEKLILRLPYRDKIKNLMKHNPYTIGMFESFYEERYLYYGRFIGTDWDGNIYIFDPIREDL